jgi:hypothetical protein
MSEIVEAPVYVNAEPVEDVMFHSVAPWKFILLTLVTFGLYELYWCYKCWKYVQANGRPGIRPFWRAVFAPLWLYSLQKAINPTVSKKRVMLIAVVYFIMGLVGNFPDPFWIISYLTFIPLLFVLREVNDLNALPEVRAKSSYSTFGWKHGLLVIASGFVTAMTVMSSLDQMPSTYAVEGSRVPSSLDPFLMDLGIYAADEEIIQFYSQGTFSYKEDGNFYTDRRVSTYWENVDDGSHEGTSAFYEDIQDIHVEYGNFIDDTLITVVTDEGVRFRLYVSTESDLDRSFSSDLIARWRAVRPAGRD